MANKTNFYPSLESFLIDEVVSGRQDINEVKSTYLSDTKNNKESHSNPYIDLKKQLDDMTLAQNDYTEIRQYENKIISNPNYLINKSNNITNMEHHDGLRNLILIKDTTDLTLGIGIVNIDTAYYVSFIKHNSPASRSQIRFGDQLIRINSLELAGISGKQVIKYINSLPNNQPISIIVRDRPLLNIFHLMKDNQNQLGVIIKNGYITKLIQNSSASRNGVPINHRIIEINGQNIIGLSNNDIIQIIKDAPTDVSISIMRTKIYEQLIKGVKSKLIKNEMDHSIMSF